MIVGGSVSSRPRPAASADGQHHAGRAIGIGELLWDLLPAGPRLGGAPFNVIAHLRRLGFEAAYVTAVGDDDLGRSALAGVSRLGVDDRFVGIVGLPTGTVRVDVDSAGVPAFEIISPSAYEVAVLEQPGEAIGRFDALVFGTLAQRFPGVRTATRRLASEHPNALRLYDVNLRDGCWEPGLVAELMTQATVLKLNEAEAAVLADEFSLGRGSVRVFAEAATERYALDGVCVTRGADGASMLLAGRFAEVPAPPVQVVDTIGAGDAFCAGLVAGIVWGRPLDGILELSSRLAALVASREGAIPDWDQSELGDLGPPT